MPFLRRGSVRIHYDAHGHPTDRPPLLLACGCSVANIEFAQAFTSGIHEFMEEI